MAEEKTDPRELPSFALVLQALDEGTVHSDCTDKMDELNMALLKYAADFGKAKGTLKLTLRFTCERGGTMDVSADIETKSPRMVRGKTTLWLTRGGRLTRVNPKQLELGVRSVPTTPVRDVEKH